LGHSTKTCTQTIQVCVCGWVCMCVGVGVRVCLLKDFLLAVCNLCNENATIKGKGRPRCVASPNLYTHAPRPFPNPHTRSGCGPARLSDLMSHPNITLLCHTLMSHQVWVWTSLLYLT
jgi:hypothetical protein